MKNLVLILLLLSLTGVCMSAVVQHGDAGPGYYPSGYNADTWTGTLTAYDAMTKSITLTYEHKGKIELFVGVLQKGLQIGVDEGVTAQGLKMGERITAYYIPENHTTESMVDGKKQKQKTIVNKIFKIVILSEAKSEKEHA